MHKSIKFIYAITIIAVVGALCAVFIISKISIDDQGAVEDVQQPLYQIADLSLLNRKDPLPKLTVRNLEINKENNFPLFESNRPEDVAIVQRINTALQKAELGMAIDEHSDWKQKYLAGGTESFSYKISYPLPNIIEIQVESYGCGAYCDGGTTYHEIDRQLGRLIHISDLFTQEGQTILQDRVFKSQENLIDDFIANTKQSIKVHGYELDDQGRQYQIDQINGYEDCLGWMQDDTLDYHGFTLASDALTVHSSACFGYAMQAIDDVGPFVYTETYKTLRPYLSEYGKHLIFGEPLASMPIF